ncbi:MAG: PAS domain S-box protein [Candidatus Altimarinota bacterium]
MYSNSELFQKIVTCMNEGIVLADEEGRILFVNPKFCELTGRKEKDLVGQDATSFYDERTAKKIKVIDRTQRKKGIRSSYEGTLITKSGDEVPVLISGTPLDQGGTFGVVTDLSEMKQKDNMYQKLVENMNEAVWVGDKNERTVYANPKFRNMMGYTLEEMLGKKSYDFWDEESCARVRHINETDRAKGKSSSYEGNLLTKKKERIPVLLSGAAIDHGTVGIMTDLRPLKEKEQKEKILNTAIQYATDAIIIFDQEGRIESWNAGAKIVFGYKKEEMLGKNISKLFNKKNTGKLLQNYQILYNFELTAKQKSQNQIKIAATLTQIPDNNHGDSGYYLLIGRDVTHQQRIEEELTLKYQKIKEAYNQYGIVRRQMDYLFDLLDISSENPDKKSIADFIVSSVIMLTRVEACVLRVYNKAKNTLDLVSSFGVDEDWQGKKSIKYQDSLAAKAFKQNMPLRIIDINEEPKYQSAYLARKHHFSSLLLIPLVSKGELTGTLSLYVSPERKLEIFENEFIERYAKLIQMIIGTVF